MKWCALSLVILYHLRGLESQLVIDTAHGVLNTDQELPKGYSTVAEPTNIITDGKLCDPNVQQYSGYIHFTGFLGDKSYFFWLLESRSNPSTDPLVVWLTGGPGCSSQMALLTENGPCWANEYGNGTIPNEFSWTNKANVIWVDQPAGAGFSSGVWDYDENGVAEDFYDFLQEFYVQLPQFKNNTLYITGESYAGHYIPAISYHIWEKNQEDSDNFKIPLKGLAIGNGLTHTEIQYTTYPDMALDGGKSEGGSLEEGVITNKFVQGIMRAAVDPCVALISECNAGSVVSIEACLGAYIVCNYGEQIPYQLSGYNPYDMRIKCDKLPLCYDFDYIETYLNRADVQETLGAKGHWTSCNMLANKFYIADYMKNYHQEIANLLDNGLDVLIYAGDVDYICNWLGNKKWVKALEWGGKEEFNMAEDEPWTLTTGEVAGRLRTYENFQFLQVYEAGHMVPMDRPQAAMEMLNSWLEGSLGRDVIEEQPTIELV